MAELDIETDGANRHRKNTVRIGASTAAANRPGLGGGGGSVVYASEPVSDSEYHTAHPSVRRQPAA
jgi:hypothetical protein